MITKIKRLQTLEMVIILKLLLLLLESLLSIFPEIEKEFLNLKLLKSMKMGLLLLKTKYVQYMLKE